MTISAGTRLGSYEVAAQIGAGGMGEVYQAHDTKLGRDVAIKVLPANFVNDPERLSRFQREARMLAAQTLQRSTALNIPMACSISSWSWSRARRCNSA
jgi:serine/threonine protein kinase